LGDSGGNVAGFSLAHTYCCSGSLGAVVRSTASPHVYYVLSNEHVFAPPYASPFVGQGITDPGLIDSSPVCSVGGTHTIGHLSAWTNVMTSSGTQRVDGAIASLAFSPSMYFSVGTVGSGLAGGHETSLNPSPYLVPFIGLAVRKTGRTTGTTYGSVLGINAVVSVAYSNDCGPGGTTTVVQYDNQILFSTGSSSSFSGAGDSGSLIVTDTANPQPVALLFAGNSQMTIGNPIGDVMSRFSVEFFAPFDQASQAGDVNITSEEDLYVANAVEYFLNQNFTAQQSFALVELDGLEDAERAVRLHTCNVTWRQLENATYYYDELEVHIPLVAARYLTEGEASNARIVVVAYDVNAAQAFLNESTLALTDVVPMVDPLFAQYPARRCSRKQQ
jgi:hypothetical protein